MTRMSSLLATASLLGSIAMAAPAAAVPLIYSFAPTTGTPSFSFSVDSNPVVSASTPFQFTTGVQNLVVNGIARTGANSFDFYSTTSASGGLFSLNVASFQGPQLYTGPANAPTLRTGTFTLFGGPLGATGILSVSAVPEPGTWGMMMIGVGLAGAAMRRRRVTTRVSYSA